MKVEWIITPVPFCLGFPCKITFAGDIPCPKTTRAVSSTEFLVCLLDEDQILARKTWQAIKQSPF
jgi:hypothetical protein